MMLIRYVHTSLGHPRYVDTIKLCRQNSIFAPINLTKLTLASCIPCSKVNCHAVHMNYKRSGIFPNTPGEGVVVDTTWLAPKFCLYVAQ